MTPESKIKSEIKSYLTKTGWYVRAIGSNQYTRPGNPDYYAVKDSVVLFIEVKSEKGKLSKAQIETQDNICAKGGHYVVAHSVEILQNYISYLSK